MDNVEHNPEVIDKITDYMKRQTRDGREMSRYGFFTAEGVLIKQYDFVCCAAIRREKNGIDGTTYLYHVWNGDAVVGANLNKMDRAYAEKIQSRFTAGPFSDRWLQFILDEKQSPWACVLPFLVSKDWRVVRESGLIFHSLDKIPFAPFYNFLIALRWSYEYNNKARFMYHIMDSGLTDDMAVAFLTALSFKCKVTNQAKLLREAGYRKEEGSRYYIKDEYGDQKWFEAEYDGTVLKFEETVSAISGDNHEPLPAVVNYGHLILNRSPQNIEGHGTVTALKNRGWDSMVWDIWKSDDGPDRHAFAKMNGKSVKEAVEFVLKFKEKGQ